jgi:transcriptional regulator with XRE-family HTH domain
VLVRYAGRPSRRSRALQTAADPGGQGELADRPGAPGRPRPVQQCRGGRTRPATTGEQVSHTTIWKLRNGQAQNPQQCLIEALAQTFGVPATFFFDDYDEQGLVPKLDAESLPG